MTSQTHISRPEAVGTTGPRPTRGFTTEELAAFRSIHG